MKIGTSPSIDGLVCPDMVRVAYFWRKEVKTMKKYISLLGAGFVTASLLGSLVAPGVLAFVDVTITTNGDSSTNNVTVNATATVFSTQDNSSDFTNTLDASAKTGKNEASSNTGGAVTITSGDATATTTVSNTGGANTATIASPTVPNSTTTVGTNGVGSSNAVNLTLDAILSAAQTNVCKKLNTLTKKARTGKNLANSNTGGPVSVTSGVATATGLATNICSPNALIL